MLNTGAGGEHGANVDGKVIVVVVVIEVDDENDNDNMYLSVDCCAGVQSNLESSSSCSCHQSSFTTISSEVERETNSGFKPRGIGHCSNL